MAINSIKNYYPGASRIFKDVKRSKESKALENENKYKEFQKTMIKFFH